MGGVVSANWFSATIRAFRAAVPPHGITAMGGGGGADIAAPATPGPSTATSTPTAAVAPAALRPLVPCLMPAPGNRSAGRDSDPLSQRARSVSGEGGNTR